MSLSTENSKRIAKNTFLLYFRMLFTMAVSLYTSRVVLNTLGIENYGIYNVVGGVVTMLAFFNSSMATSTQRFLNYEMGKGNNNNLKKVFSNSLNAHYLIGIVSTIALETIGLWFINNKLNIPALYFDSAIWVFHCSVLSFFISIISTPYNAAIIANEKMGVYAYFSIIEVILKLIIVYLLVIIPFNKLKLYALLQLFVSLLMRGLYNWYCIRKFPECKYQWSWEKKTMTKMFSFTGWMLFGCISDILSKQGTNILINLFFGPVFNAARAIAIQIQTAINSFIQNFMTAVRPQIIKSYSSHEFEYMYKLVFASSKLGYYLLFILATPILIYTEYILQIWLKQVPELSVIFTRLILIELLITSSYTPIAQVNQASGKIRNYQIAISFLFLLNFITTYIAFYLKYPVYSTFIISIIFSVIGLFIRIFILKKENDFPAREYLRKVILPIIPISITSVMLPIIIKNHTSTNPFSIIMNSIFTLTISTSIIWRWGLNTVEKELIENKIKTIYKKIQHNDKN